LGKPTPTSPTRFFLVPPTLTSNFVVRITPSHQTVSMGSRPRHLFRPHNYRILLHLYQARGRLPPSCRAAPCRVRQSRRVHLLSRRARPSPRAPTPFQTDLPLRAQVVSILSGTSDRSGTVARRSVARRSVWVPPLDLLRHRHNIIHLCIMTILFSAPLHFLPCMSYCCQPFHFCMYRKLVHSRIDQSPPIYRVDLYFFNSIEQTTVETASDLARDLVMSGDFKLSEGLSLPDSRKQVKR
jgi:hypothetical protein